jgi:hypothetical protein
VGLLNRQPLSVHLFQKPGVGVLPGLMSRHVLNQIVNLLEYLKRRLLQ